MTAQTDILRSTAAIATPQSARYMTQLCKHFEHRCPAKYDAESGQISFPMGECHLRATPGLLTMTVEAADAAQLAQMQEVVARHLLRFAFREEMQVDWQPA